MRRKDFGEYLKKLRLRKGLTMEQAAEALGYTSMGALNSYQRGLNTPPIEKLFDIARVYDEPIENIIQELEKSDPKKVRLFYELEARFIGFFVQRIQSDMVKKNVAGAELTSYTLSDLVNQFTLDNYHIWHNVCFHLL